LVSRTSRSLCGCSDGDSTLEARAGQGLGFTKRRAFVAGGLWGAAAFSSGCEQAIAQSSSSPTGDLPLTLRGTPQQSGILVGETLPGAVIDAAGIQTRAGADGKFLIGFDRDAPPTANIVVTRDNRRTSRSLTIAPRAYQVRNISGLPSATVNPPASAMARIEREAALKARAFNSRDEIARGFDERWRWPLASVRVTSPWGAVRRLNGELQRPHYGIDLGGGVGTPIYAPASGLVILAEPDMHFEGGIVAIDHGQGLISIYLHQSRLIAQVGQRVVAGTQIGAIGAKGRATGPHLCWRLRWRGRQLDPSLRVA
jgi:murein DD-endopeptidase MepM/ murein hydrolase activator NlpD